jgi:hypothetical protein
MKRFVFLLLLLAACVVQPPAEENITLTPEPDGATFGDLVTINYVLLLENGTVVDTNDAALAEQYGIKNYVKGHFTFILGQSGKVKGFDDALLGMQEGEHKESTIEPSEKEVTFLVNKTKAVNRFITINLKQVFPLTAFERSFGKKPVKNDIVKSQDFVFKYKVLNFTNESVITEMVLKEGETYVLPNTYWNSSVVRLAEEDVMFYQQPEENQSIDAPFGTAFINMTKSRMFINFHPELNKIFNKSIEIGGGFTIPQQFQVTQINEEDFVITRYGLLTDKRLKLKADLITRVKDVKKVKQTAPYITEVVGGNEN